MKKITIHNEASIKAVGSRTHKNTKAVLCIETGEVWTSSADAAEDIGVHFSVMSAVCTGKIKTCHGKHYCYLNEALENLDAVMSRLRDASAMEEDAKKWRAQEAEKEAARKAEEKRIAEELKAQELHAAAVAKAEKRVAKWAARAEKYQEMYNTALNELDNANRELEELLGE